LTVNVDGFIIFAYTNIMECLECIVELATKHAALDHRETSEAALLSRVFMGLSEPTRLQILLVLLEGERNVSELVTIVGSSQGRVSMHLQCLRWCGYVTSERRGRYVYYRVRDARVQELVALARAFATSYHHELASCRVLNSGTAQVEEAE
jgi:ArsR family transcriptional regulator, cadmium/lead-responsive transcriptional repressor